MFFLVVSDDDEWHAQYLLTLRSLAFSGRVISCFPRHDLSWNPHPGRGELTAFADVLD